MDSRSTPQISNHGRWLKKIGHSISHVTWLVCSDSFIETICGEIKQNESELEHIIFLVFYLMLFSIQRASFAENPIKIGHVITKL